jgi:ankyrin repeat protein
VDINERDGDGWSALMHAVGEGHLSAVRSLIEIGNQRSGGTGLTINVQDVHDLWTPLFHAVHKYALQNLHMIVLQITTGFWWAVRSGDFIAAKW